MTPQPTLPDHYVSPRRLLVTLILSVVALTGSAHGYAQPSSLPLPDAVARHLAELGDIRMCVDPDYLPYERINDEGRHVGIAADLLEQYAQLLGTHFTLIPTTSWQQTLDYAAERRCDIVSFLNDTPDRRAYLSFTAPILSSEILIIARDETGYVSGLNALGGKRMALVPGYRTEQAVRHQFPALTIVSAPSMDDAFRMVAEGDADATLETLRTALPRIQLLGLDNLRVAGQTPFTDEYRIGVRNDDPLLLSALNLAVDRLDPVKAHAIFESWLKVPVLRRADTWPYLLSLVLLLAAGLVLINRYYRMYRTNTLLQAHNHQLQRLNEVDHLTGIANRLKSDQRLHAEWMRARRYGRPLTLALVDVDHFKRINDTLGHAEGDRVLVALGQILSVNLRQHDHVGRWGGEEFLLLFPEVDAEQGVLIANKLRQAIANHHFDSGVRVTCSFGVTSLASHDDIGALLKRADDALYQAKRQGRDRVIPLQPVEESDHGAPQTAPSHG